MGEVLLPLVAGDETEAAIGDKPIDRAVVALAQRFLRGHRARPRIPGRALGSPRHHLLSLSRQGFALRLINRLLLGDELEPCLLSRLAVGSICMVGDRPVGLGRRKRPVRWIIEIEIGVAAREPPAFPKGKLLQQVLIHP